MTAFKKLDVDWKKVLKKCDQHFREGTKGWTKEEIDDFRKEVLKKISQMRPNTRKVFVELEAALMFELGINKYEIAFKLKKPILWVEQIEKKINRNEPLFPKASFLRGQQRNSVDNDVAIIRQYIGTTTEDGKLFSATTLAERLVKLDENGQEVRISKTQAWRLFKKAQMPAEKISDSREIALVKKEIESFLGMLDSEYFPKKINNNPKS